jgi:Family of unknown function (DUF6221)
VSGPWAEDPIVGYPIRWARADGGRHRPVTGLVLVEFSRARLDEAERASGEVHRQGCRSLVEDRPCDCGYPVYVLADIAAKRRILDLHALQNDERGRAQCAYCARLCHSNSGLWCGEPDAPYPCETVRILVAPFATHPDYDPAWSVSMPMF